MKTLIILPTMGFQGCRLDWDIKLLQTVHSLTYTQMTEGLRGQGAQGAGIIPGGGMGKGGERQRT